MVHLASFLPTTLDDDVLVLLDRKFFRASEILSVL
jgi:hypothetical protein